MHKNEKTSDLLNEIDAQHEIMTHLLKKWASINSGSSHAEGLEEMAILLDHSFSLLQPDSKKKLPHSCLLFSKRKTAPVRILFGGHFDTVFSKTHPFQKVTSLDNSIIRGPGVADMKGGLIVLLKALEVFEKLPSRDTIGWEILLNSDEETGSTHSLPFYEECAKSCDIALLFEPCLPDGSLVSSRKSSSTYLIVSEGTAAHAGRDFSQGKNAILPLFRWLVEMTEKPLENGVIFNIGSIQGGGPVNIVPHYAESRLNIRTDTIQQLEKVEEKMYELVKKHGLTLTRLTHRPPKPLTPEVDSLLSSFQLCGRELGIQLQWRSTGGVCDGNSLAAFGLPTVDTLGVRGDNIHTDQEFVSVSSLTERAKLTALFLSKVSTGEIKIPRRLA